MKSAPLKGYGKGGIAMEEKHYRHELKYAIAYGDYLAMRARLKAVMTTAPHTSADGLYRIRTRRKQPSFLLRKSVRFPFRKQEYNNEKSDSLRQLFRNPPKAEMRQGGVRCVHK